MLHPQPAGAASAGGDGAAAFSWKTEPIAQLQHADHLTGLEPAASSTAFYVQLDCHFLTEEFYPKVGNCHYLLMSFQPCIFLMKQKWSKPGSRTVNTVPTSHQSILLLLAFLQSVYKRTVKCKQLTTETLSTAAQVTENALFPFHTAQRDSFNSFQPPPAFIIVSQFSWPPEYLVA